MQNIDYESIGLRIKNYRINKKKWSQEELAEKAETTRTSIGRIETGTRIPSIEALVSIANALDVSANDLLFDNLTSAKDTPESDLHYLLLDCTPAESKIITRNAKELRNLLRDFQIK